MRHKATRALFEYWGSKRRGRMAPTRGEIQPREIKRLLPNLFILEQLNRDTLRFRLAGTGFCHYYGMEFRSYNMLLMWEDECRENMARLLERVVGEGVAGLVDYTAETLDGEQAGFELLLLPLAQEEGMAARILGLAAPLERPQWLGDHMLVRQWIDRIRLLGANDDEPVPAEPDRQLAAGAERNHLRLIKA